MAYCCDVERKKLTNRVARISGQIKSIEKKLKDEEYHLEEDPYEMLRQLTAVKGAVNGMITSYVEHFAKGHFIDKIQKGDSIQAQVEVDNFLEIIKVFGK